MSEPNNGFLKIKRSGKLLELIKTRPTAYGLLTLIALRAKRTTDTSMDGLKVGQAYVGDYKNYGVTMQIYRTDKLFLEKWGFSTFQSTNKGTIATLCDDSVYDINATSRPTHKSTIDQQATNNQLTTNKNIKNDKNIKNIYIPEVTLLQITQELSISLSDTKRAYQELTDYCASKGKTYKDYPATLRNWLRRKIEDGKVKVISLPPAQDSEFLRQVVERNKR